MCIICTISINVSVCVKEERECSVQRLYKQERTVVVRAGHTGTEQSDSR